MAGKAQETANGNRIAIFSRYQLSEQYALAAEFRTMLETLCENNRVLHLSFRNTNLPSVTLPDRLELAEIPLSVDRRSARDIMIKSLLMYICMPLAAWRLRRFKPDVIFVSEILPLCGLIFKWFCNARVATAYGDWHVHNFLERKWWSRPLIGVAEALEKLEVRTLDGFFCRASSAGKRLISMGASEKQIRVVNDAPDLTAFYPQEQRQLRHDSGFDENDIVLLYHGVMHQGKGLDRLLTWTADLYRENPRIGIFMVGSGPELKTLQALAIQLGLGKRAVFTGWLKSVNEVGTFCNAADICVAMRTGAESNVHIIPGALLHSMACRKVVIAPDLPGILEVIRDGENGFVFKADDGDAFKALIRRIGEDRSLCDRVAEQAFEDIVHHFSVPATARNYADAIMHYALLV